MNRYRPTAHCRSLGRRTAKGELRFPKDVVTADGSPYDVRLAGLQFRPIVERGPSIACPRHLPHSAFTLNTFHPESWMKVAIVKPLAE